MGIPKTEIIKFAWLKNLGVMIDEDIPIKVGCTECKAWESVDLKALAEKVGRDYELYNRRCPCRLTPGCRGWNSFNYLHGVYRPLRDSDTGLRWAVGSRYSR